MLKRVFDQGLEVFKYTVKEHEYATEFVQAKK